MFLDTPGTAIRSVGPQEGLDDARRPRIAVLDDDPLVLELVRELLEDQGFRVLTCDDLRRGFERVEAWRPDLAILDLVQERQPIGLQVLAGLRADRRFQALPLIVMSADALRLQRVAREHAGDGLAVLCKPFDLQVLVDLVEQMLLRTWDPFGASTSSPF